MTEFRFQTQSLSDTLSKTRGLPSGNKCQRSKNEAQNQVLYQNGYANPDQYSRINFGEDKAHREGRSASGHSRNLQTNQPCSAPAITDEISKKVQPGAITYPADTYEGYYTGKPYYENCSAIKPPPSRIWYQFSTCPRNQTIFAEKFREAHWFANYIIHNVCCFLNYMGHKSEADRTLLWKRHSEKNSQYSLHEYFGPYSLTKFIKVYRVMTNLARGMHAAQDLVNRRIQFRCDWAILGGEYKIGPKNCYSTCNADASANPPLKTPLMCDVDKCCTIGGKTKTLDWYGDGSVEVRGVFLCHAWPKKTLLWQASNIWHEMLHAAASLPHICSPMCSIKSGNCLAPGDFACDTFGDMTKLLNTGQWKQNLCNNQTYTEYIFRFRSALAAGHCFPLKNLTPADWAQLVQTRNVPIPGHPGCGDL